MPHEETRGMVGARGGSRPKFTPEPPFEPAFKAAVDCAGTPAVTWEDVDANEWAYRQWQANKGGTAGSELSPL